MQSTHKLLVDDAEACAMLSIPPETLAWLIATEQLAPINIRGRRLFPARQLEELIRTYAVVQARGRSNAPDNQE